MLRFLENGPGNGILAMIKFTGEHTPLPSVNGTNGYLGDFLPESQDYIMVLTVLYVPNSLDIRGPCRLAHLLGISWYKDM